jgi:hypothetical protein
VIGAPTAADLGAFGKREWMTGIVMDYSNHFAWLKNAQWFKDAQAKAAAGESVEFINPDGSEMADWTSGNVESLKSAENAENVKALSSSLPRKLGHAGLNSMPRWSKKERNWRQKATGPER